MSTSVGAEIHSRREASGGEPCSVIWTLARIEARRLLCHPIFLGGAMLALVLLAGLPRGTPGASYWGLVGWGLFPLVAATLLATNLAALRTRRDATDELYDALPIRADARTVSLLLAVGFAAAVGVVFVAAAYLYLDAGSGLKVGWYGETAVPSARELAQGPAAVLAFGVLGVALARWLPHVAVAPLVVFAVLASEMVVEGTTPVNRFVDHRLTWFFPFANPSVTPSWSFWPCYQSPANPCDVERFAVASAGWHLLYLAALTALFALLALMRRAPARLLLPAAAVALLAVAVAGVLQLP